MKLLALGAVVPTLLLIVAAVFAPPAQAQSYAYQKLHDFTGGRDGANPESGVTLSVGDILYGTTHAGGTDNDGVVFEVRSQGSGHILDPLYSFKGGEDGSRPTANPVTIGPNGNLYGAVQSGGGHNAGVAYNLHPAPTVCTAALCLWDEGLLYTFMGGTDGWYPVGRLIFDRVGNIYGVTSQGGASGCGTVWEMTPSDGGWTETTLVSFNSTNGCQGQGGVIADSAGNLYGVTSNGGFYGYGVVYELTNSGAGWSENVLYNFQDENDGGYPFAGLIFDTAGNLYGATSSGGIYGGGTAFELTPSGMGWTFNILASFGGTGADCYCGPADRLVMDNSGNIYGAQYGPGRGYGWVFKMTNSNGMWTFTYLYQFTGGDDGAYPIGVALDSSGDVLGVTQLGGANGVGVVFELTPQ